MNQIQSEVIGNARPRYEILDGLRGVAAVIVVIFHLLETYSKGIPSQLLNHGYLAVDFFFVLSGFVVGYAYDGRWKQGMTIGNFCVRRLIRLQPMLIFGTIVGALVYYMQADHPSFAPVIHTPWWIVILLIIWGGTAIPIPKSWDVRGLMEFNPLNSATWSLVWEYAANLVYALVLRRLGLRTLMVLTSISALFTISVCMNWDLFDVLDARSYGAYTIVGGWSLTPDQLLIGFTRLAYPFLMGLIISRISKMQIHIMRHGFIWCSIVMVIVLCMPRVGGVDPDNFWMNGLYESVSILMIFPLIIMMGRGSSVAGERYEKACKFLGNISYPLYVTHYPLVYVQMSWAATHDQAPVSTHIYVGCCFFIISLALAYASMKLYDIPVRVWLSEKFLKARKRKNIH